jgi:hypothetical protein
MKSFPAIFKSAIAAATLVFALHARDCSAEIGFDLYANVLRTSAGNPMPTTGLVLLVCSSLDTNFSGPSTNGLVSGDDVILGKWDLTLNNNPGEFSGSTGPWTIGVSNVTAGDPVALFWFPTLNISSTSVTNGTRYGMFTDAVGLDGDAFFVPSDGSSYFLSFNTPAVGGGNFSETQGYASFAVGNHAPVANPDTFTRNSGIAIKMKISSLLTNDTDADGDSLTITTVSASTNSVTLTSDSNYVYYPASAPNVADRFSYTVTDGKGTFSTTTVTLQMATATGTNSTVSLKVGVPGAGTNTISFAGVPNYAYITQYATNIAGPWLALSTNTAATNGLWTVIDTKATNATRFYRVTR